MRHNLEPHGRTSLSNSSMSGLFRASRVMGYFRFIDISYHVERLLGITRELVVQDPLTAIEGFVQLRESALESGELLGHEERLGQEAFQPPGAVHGALVLLGKLLEPEHGNDVLELLVLGQRAP